MEWRRLRAFTLGFQPPHLRAGLTNGVASRLLGRGLPAGRRRTYNSLALEVAALAALAMPPFEGEAVAGSGAGNFMHSSAASAMLRHSSCFNVSQLSKVAFSRATPSRLRPMRAV